ncbi:MAG: response regulator transcription factor [Breznakibacter sp.]
MKVLVCEDERLVGRAIQIVLEKAGYDVKLAVDGNEAMECIENEVFSAIIVDVHLPYASGLEIIGQLRKEKDDKVPIIVVTAISDNNIQRQAQLLGANKYLLKPYDPKQLVNVVHELLNNN